MSSSSSSGISNHPVDQMYRANRRMGRGAREVQNLSNDCCHKEGKVGAAVGGVILGGLFSAIPPPGAFTVLGAALGAMIGSAIGESCRDEHKKQHRD